MPVRNAARLLVLGVSLGVGAFIVDVLLSFQITTVLFQLERSDSIWWWILTRLMIEQLGVLLVAPVIAYGAGLILDGRRWVLAGAMVVTLQGVSASMRVVSFGSGLLLTATEIVLLLVFTAIGVVLSAWAMGRGQARMRVRADQKPVAAPPSLAAIDFEAVKKQQEQPAAAPAPAQSDPPAKT
jgi:hypothetical protein